MRVPVGRRHVGDKRHHCAVDARGRVRAPNVVCALAPGLMGDRKGQAVARDGGEERRHLCAQRTPRPRDPFVTSTRINPRSGGLATPSCMDRRTGMPTMRVRAAGNRGRAESDARYTRSATSASMRDWRGLGRALKLHGWR